MLQGVNSETMLYTVIGDPIRQSKSPLMMNRAFRETGTNGVYIASHIRSAQLADFVTSARVLGIRGMNVTIPHKVNIMPFLDILDESARVIGAVNTIVNDNGVLTGYNTDGIGYVRSLKEEVAPHLAGKNIVIVGAGGAARGIIYALIRENVGSIVIANRTLEKAEELAMQFRALANISAIAMNEFATVCAHADIVINTTSVGMFPQVDETPFDVTLLREGTIVSDLIYNPLKTRVLELAEQRGCPIHGGLGMFIYQGAFAFEYWTGKPAPTVAMREEVLAALTTL